MQEPTFMVLTALAAGPAHGYGIIREVEELSGGRVSLRASTLYAALDRLADQGLVEMEREEAVAGRLRRYYRLTETGAAALTEAAQRQQKTAKAALSRLRLGGLGSANAFSRLALATAIALSRMRCGGHRDARGTDAFGSANA